MLVSIVVFVTSLVATFLSSMSGGGAGLIAVPVWFFLGISYPVAMTIQTACSVFWVLPASYNYLCHRKIDWVFLLLFGLIGTVGAWIGAMAVAALDVERVHVFIGIIILLLVCQTALKKDLGLYEKHIPSRIQRIAAYPFSLLLGFYEIVFGAGNAIVFSVVTFWTRGFDFKKALGYYYAVAFPWSLLALVLLYLKGYLVLSFAVPAVIGSVLGGYLGSLLARYRGNAFIKTIFVVLGGILGLKILLGY